MVPKVRSKCQVVSVKRPTFERTMVDYSRRPWWLLLPGVLAFVWVSVLGYEGLNGQDAHDYLRLARAWLTCWKGGPVPPVAEHPHGFPIMGAVLGSVLGPVLALRIISLVAYGAVVLLVYHLLRKAADRREVRFVYVLLGVAMSPFVLRYGMTSLSDVSAIAFLLAALVCSLSWRNGRSRMALAGVPLFLALALTVRLAVAPLAMLILALMFETLLQRPLRWRSIAVIVAVGAFACAVLMPELEGRGLLQGTPLAEWSPLNWFRRELRSDDGTLRYALPNLVYACCSSVHPGQFPLGLLLLPFTRRADVEQGTGRVAAILLLGYLLFVAGMPFQNDRVLLMGQPFTVLLFYPAFERAFDRIQQIDFKPIVVVLTLCLLETGLFVRAMLPFIRQARVERELAAAVNTHAPSMIYSHGMGASLDNYCAPTPVVELWYSTLDRFEHGAIIVVHPASLNEQWQGTPPGINWSRARTQGLDIIASRDDGWVLARLR